MEDHRIIVPDYTKLAEMAQDLTELENEANDRVAARQLEMHRDIIEKMDEAGWAFRGTIETTFAGGTRISKFIFVKSPVPHVYKFVPVHATGIDFQDLIDAMNKEIGEAEQKKHFGQINQTEYNQVVYAARLRVDEADIARILAKMEQEEWTYVYTLNNVCTDGAVFIFRKPRTA